MKKTLTRTEAREWLKDKYVPVFSIEDAFKALKIFENIGFKIDQFADSDGDDEFPWHVLPDDEDEVGICWSGYRVHHMDKETFELYLSDLLAIEIVEKPDHRALLEELKTYTERLINLVEDIDGTLFHHNHAVVGWHKNDDHEPMMNFVSDFDMDAVEAAKAFLEANKTIPKSK